MKKLFVGCRVRIKWSHCFPELGGREARITGDEAFYQHMFDGTIRTGWPVDIHPKFYPASEQLEPITPSGAAPSEYTYTELMDRLKAGEVERV